MKAGIERALHTAWSKKGGFSLAMWPLSKLYGAIVEHRKAGFLRHPDRIHHDTLPVVVVGNIYVGGTGKTPVVIALVEALQARGWQPGVISRGYGARPSDKPRAGRGTLDPALFGDEPALVAAHTGAPVCVHPDRQAAIRRLRRQYPQVDVVISDDGLQHLALGRDLEIVVQDGRGVGNGRLLPAGPLREPATRLETVDFIINNLLPGEAPPPSPGRSCAMTGAAVASASAPIAVRVFPRRNMSSSLLCVFSLQMDGPQRARHANGAAGIRPPAGFPPRGRCPAAGTGWPAPAAARCRGCRNARPAPG